MISKGSRMNTKEVLDVIKNGKRLSSPFFSVIFLKKDDIKVEKFAVIASKKLFPRAVDRNFVRRRVMNAIKNLKNKTLSGVFVIFMSKKEVFNVKFSILKEEISLKLIQISKI